MLTIEMIQNILDIYGDNHLCDLEVKGSNPETASLNAWVSLHTSDGPIIPHPRPHSGGSSVQWAALFNRQQRKVIPDMGYLDK